MRWTKEMGFEIIGKDSDSDLTLILDQTIVKYRQVQGSFRKNSVFASVMSSRKLEGFDGNSFDYGVMAGGVAQDPDGNKFHLAVLKKNLVSYS